MVNTLCKKPYNRLEKKIASFDESFDLVESKHRSLLNMDETGVHLEVSHKQTLTVKGEKHVIIIGASKENNWWQWSLLSATVLIEATT